MHLKVTVLWLATLKLLLMIPMLLKLLAEIHRDYQVLPKMIQKIESSKYIIKEAHADISALDIGAYIKKRMLKNVENIVNLEQEDISPALCAELQCCQSTTVAVERSFSMLGKLLCKDRPFSLENVEKYLYLYYNEYRL